MIDSQKTMVGFLDRIAARIEIGPQERPLTKEQLAELISRLGIACQQGVARSAARISGVRAAAVGVACGASLLAGVVTTFVVMHRAAVSDMDAARIEVPAVFDTLSAADASAWAKLIRDNPPISRLLASAVPITWETRGKAVGLAVWVDPQRLPTPGAH
jgi:hypothetical protein